MIEERITETTDATGNVTERVIERGTPTSTVTPVAAAPVMVERSGGGMGGIFAVLLLIAVAIGAYFLFVANDSETRKDDAVAEAADNVGAAAQKAGDAVEKAVDNIDGK